MSCLINKHTRLSSATALLIVVEQGQTQTPRRQQRLCMILRVIMVENFLAMVVHFSGSHNMIAMEVGQML